MQPELHDCVLVPQQLDLAQLEEQFGIKEIPGEIIAWGSERLLLFTGEAEKYELEKIIESAALEKIGVYFAKIINGELKLTIEGSQILNEQIKKNILLKYMRE